MKLEKPRVMDLLVEILEHAQSYRTCKESMHNSSLAIWVGYSQSRRFAHDFNSLLNVVLGMLRSSREQVEGCVADKYLVHVQLIVKGISYLGFLGDQGLYSAGTQCQNHVSEIQVDIIKVLNYTLLARSFPKTND